MRASLRCGNQIHVGFGNYLAALGQPLNCPIHSLGLSLELRPERSLGDHRKIAGGVGQIIRNTILIVPFGFLFLFLVGESDPEAGTQDRFGAQRVA